MALWAGTIFLLVGVSQAKDVVVHKVVQAGFVVLDQLLANLQVQLDDRRKQQYSILTGLRECNVHCALCRVEAGTYARVMPPVLQSIVCNWLHHSRPQTAMPLCLLAVTGWLFGMS